MFSDQVLKSVSGTAYNALTIIKINHLIFPIPPLEEQRRIVERIDRLMDQVDVLEKLRAERDNKRLVIQRAAGDRLLKSQTEQELGEAWDFLKTHFNELYSVKENVSELRKAILQLAVMGKLVPQDPNDPPASELMETLRIARLNRYQKLYPNSSEAKTMIRKIQKLDCVAPPFDIPKTWKTIHLIDSCEFLVDCHNKTATYSDSGIPIIRTNNIRDGKIRFQNMKYINQDTYEFWSRRCPPKPQDIIFTREAPMGEAAIIPDESIFCLGQRTMLIRPMHDFILNKYLLIALTEPNLLERASSSAIGSTVKHLRVGDVERLSIPLPPLPEQHRIVAKVDQLMALCDRLEADIEQRTSKQTKLLNAVMAEVS